MNDKLILFSVIIPTYNRAAFIESAIHSVQQQDYKNWELIVVNDGSTDETESIVKSIKDNKIKYVSIPNSERGAARNTGIKMATGDFVCFLDSDDRLLLNHLTEANKFLVEHPQTKIFHQDFEIRDHNDKILIASKKLPLLLNDSLIRNNVISANAIFINAQVARENLFNEDRALSASEDYELWLRLAMQYPIFHNPVLTSIILEHSQRSMQDTDYLKLLKRIEKLIECVDENTKLKNWLGKRYSKFISWRYSYISLHASLTNHKKEAFNYLMKALLEWPPLILTTRFLVILKNILF